MNTESTFKINDLNVSQENIYILRGKKAVVDYQIKLLEKFGEVFRKEYFSYSQRKLILDALPCEANEPV